MTFIHSTDALVTNHIDAVTVAEGALLRLPQQRLTYPARMPIRQLLSLVHARVRPELAALLGASLACESTPATQSPSLLNTSHTGPLSGVHIVVKDNIDVAGLPTTAGSLALKDNIAAADAPIVARLRAAGVVVDGKANLSEWANFRSTASTSGWSAVGGLTRNPHDPKRSACGSSSGSAAAVASGLVPLAIGTETDGSIVCPAAMCGVVGLKPTFGLLPGDGIVPISTRQDTAGPIAANVRLAALGLCAMAGSDQYSVTVDANALRGTRLGVMRFDCGRYGDAVDATFNRACESLRADGAELVDVADAPDLERISQLEWPLLLEEFKDDINAYLSTRPASVETRTLAHLIAFNESHRAEEMPYFGQEIFELSQATQGRVTPDYAARAAEAARLAGPEGIDRMLRDHQCVALIAPTAGRAFPIRLEGGDQHEGSCSRLPAVAGYPHLTVPMGLADGLPVGLSFIGTAHADATLLMLGAAFELARDHADSSLVQSAVAITDEAPPAPVIWTTGTWIWTTVPEWGLDAAHPIGATHGGVIVDHHDHPHFNTDAPHGTLVFDSAGARLGTIAGEYAGIHGMQLRVEDGVEYLYAAHLRGKQAVKLRMDGTAVWTIGVPTESHKYDDNASAFNPTAVAVAPDGRLFIADGYGRNWIHAYSPDRTYLKSFGGRGAEPGQFQTCHGLGIDEHGRAATDGSGSREPLLVVCDRENRRLERFTLAGELVDVPVTGLRRPCSIAFWNGPNGERLIAVAELEGRATILDGDYRVLGYVGTNDDPKQMAANGVAPSDWQPGITTAPHGIGFDADGNLYIEDWNATGRVHKFVRGVAPRANAMMRAPTH